MFFWPKKLNQRLSLSLWLLLLLLSVAHYGVYRFLYNQSEHETEQRLHWQLASELARDFRPQLEPVLRSEELTKQFFNLTKINPRLEPYLLDEKGKIVLSLPRIVLPKGTSIRLEPIKSFLEAEADRKLPIYGDNPLDQFNAQSSFSVSQVKIGDSTGFLYIVLKGEVAKSLAQSLEDIYLVRGAFGLTALVTTMVAILGTLVFHQISSRFGTISSVVHEIANGNLEQRIPPSKEQDEIAQLGSEINVMADRISDNVEELKRTDQLRRDLVANISHDIVSPLALAHGSIEQITEAEATISNNEMKQLGIQALANLQVVLKLLRELFELSKLEARDIEPRIEPFSIQDIVIEELVPRLLPLALKHQVQLRTESPNNLPFVQGDTDLVERAIHNLIENAIKYNNPGGEVRVRLSESGKSILVEVEDNGPGIPQEQLPFIFDRFHRVHQERRRDIPGSGLGLAIVKNALATQGIEIKVSSKEGSGSNFSFELPLVQRSGQKSGW